MCGQRIDRTVFECECHPIWRQYAKQLSHKACVLTCLNVVKEINGKDNLDSGAGIRNLSTGETSRCF